MSLYKARKASKQALDRDHLRQLFRTIDQEETLDLLWECMQESESSYAELNALREKIQTLNSKSGQRARCLGTIEGRRALVKIGPVTEELLVSPSVDIEKLVPGCEVLVIGAQDGRVVADIRESSLNEGRFSKIVRKIDETRFIIEDGGHQLIMRTVHGVACDVGDEVRYDLESLLILETLKHKEDASFSLSEVPIATFDDVKGLEEEKRYLRERIIYPTVYKDRFEKYGLKGVRGAILHGPPGCGKTLLASAIFNEMAKIKNVSGAKGFFVVNGPEMLSKWAGQTEEAIRRLFFEARKVAQQSGLPSIIFWDEIESIASRRKDSATYTPEKTVVPTLLTELQGLKGAGDILLLAATNRPDLVDPALMRPGRLGDAILEIPRPEKEGALEIVKANVRKGEIPHGLKMLVEQGLEEKIVSYVYDNEKPLANAKLESGEIVGIMRQELVNGALFAQIGEELVRATCMKEIYGEDSISVADAIQMVDTIFLNQIGVMDAGTKNGFNYNAKDIIMDVSLNG